MAPVSKACIRALLSLGRAIARMIRMIAITINNSMSEKPVTRRYLLFNTRTPFPPLYDERSGRSVQTKLRSRILLSPLPVSEELQGIFAFVQASDTDHLAADLLQSLLRCGSAILPS